MTSDLRQNFHQRARRDPPGRRPPRRVGHRAGAARHRDPPRPGPRGRRVRHPRRRRDRLAFDRDRGAMPVGARPAGARRQRPPTDRVGTQAGTRDRAVRRPVRQHLQGGAAYLRTRSRSEVARRHPEDGRAGADVVQGGDRGVPQPTTASVRPPSTTWTPISTTCSASSCNRSSRATPPAPSICRSRCSWRSSPASSSASVITP